MTDHSSVSQQEANSAASSEPFHFPAGIPGFEDHKNFILVSRENMRPFLWLQSVDNEEVSLPVISCLLLTRKVLRYMTEEHLALIGTPPKDQVAPYYVLRVDSQAGTITANTKAPIVINLESKEGYQVFMEGDDLRVDEPLANLAPSSSRRDS